MDPRHREDTGLLRRAQVCQFNLVTLRTYIHTYIRTYVYIYSCGRSRIGALGSTPARSVLEIFRPSYAYNHVCTAYAVPALLGGEPPSQLALHEKFASSHFQRAEMRMDSNVHAFMREPGS
ncbi:hypothetical protein MGYG_06667 [Nannizzia gypsea CBS 118893]|uniref:Uncharacterized protein n=1 Tax=Arthroderma gypseum (strain ATCC MYA-4604 / CBS 118893) TaxID=535722 RepID=E4V0V6_ARTGP|nr:hypothetical protein MGYG_06667 [Nannizzia gypsea CBS 118893]EFR03671.1 hypothetical protein MGYG_06667 [Nannizzia gypsea CBS 118893]